MGVLKAVERRLVADYGTIARMWSVQWAALGALLLPLMTVVPSLPPDVQALLPPKARVAVTGLWSLTYIALRAWPQKTLRG